MRMASAGRKNNYQHGMVGTRTYSTWTSMMRRCHNPNEKAYAGYGANGIFVCRKWRKFAGFFEDMGERPEGTSIDRINNKIGYFKSNCKWSTEKQQQNNKSSNVFYSVNGVTKSPEEWSHYSGVNVETIRSRINDYGWSVKDAVLSPVRSKHKSHRILTLDGISMPIGKWSVKLGISDSTIDMRLKNGWTMERALTTGRLS